MARMRIRPRYDVKAAILAYLIDPARGAGKGRTRGEIANCSSPTSRASEIQEFLDQLSAEGKVRSEIRRDVKPPFLLMTEYFAILPEVAHATPGKGRGVRMEMIRCPKGKEVRTR